MTIHGIILGRKRQGKTTVALAIAQRFHTAIFIFDPNCQFKGFLTFQELSSFSEWLHSAPSHFTVVFRPLAEDISGDFELFIRSIREANIGNIALIIDESSSLQSPHQMNPQLSWLLRQAPRDGMLNAAGQSVEWMVLQTTHRHTDVHGDAKFLVSDWWFFQTNYRRDLEWTQSQLPEDIGPEIREILPALPRFHVVHVWIDYDGRTRYSIWRHPERWRTTIDATMRFESGSGSMGTGTGRTGTDG